MQVIPEREEMLIRMSKNPDLTRIKIQLAKDMIRFGRVCISEMCTKPSPPFHYDMASYLSDLDRPHINIVAPRGHAKSSVVACTFVLWHVFLEDIYRFIVGLSDNPKGKPKFVILISKTQGEAKRRLSTIKRVIGNENGKYEPGFRALFGNYGYGTHRKWTTEEVILKDGTTFTAIGTGQQGRGLKEGHQRPTLAVPDDPEDELNTKTAKSMEDNMKWLQQTVVPALDADIGRVVVIGTPQNHSCMVVRLHETIGWASAWYGNDLDTNSSSWNQDNYDKKGVLWPELMGEDKLTDLKDSLRSLGMLGSYYREYETKVVGDEDQLFKPEYFRDWEGELEEDLVGNRYLRITHRSAQGGKIEKLDEPELVPINIFMGVDPASSTNARADYTVIMMIGVDSKGNIYVIDYIRRRMPPATVLQSVKNMYETYKPDRGCVETTQAQEYIVSLLRNDGIFLIGKKPRMGKEERLVHLEPAFSAGKVFTKLSHTDLKKEFMTFPKGRHDDIMDAFDLAQGIKMRPTHGIVSTEEALKASKTRRKFDPMLA